jgi:hypothetical protein
VNIHNYDFDITSYNQQVHGWMNDNGASDYPVWLGEWGTYSGGYDTLGFSLTTLQNMIRGSRPGNEHVDGSLIFSMYDWVSDVPADRFAGIVSGSGDPTWTYYSFRMGSRALQGCRKTYRSTASTGDLTAITTKDGDGNLYLLAVNRGSSDLDVDADLSALGTTGTGSLWRHDSLNADTLRNEAPDLVGGHVDVTVPANGAALVKLTGVTMLADTFEDGDSAGWSSSGGTWQVTQPPGQSREYTKTSSDDGLSTAGSTAWSDYRVQAYVKLADEAGGAALLGRVQDSTHYYQLELKKDSSGTKKWWIWKRDGSTWTNLASGNYSFSPGTYYLLRLDLDGSRLTASVSANYGAGYQPLGSATDTAYGAGKVGVRSFSSPAGFDEVRVSPL